MKKTIWMGCIALMLGTLLLLSACSSAATTTQESKSPYQQGLELIALMEEMANSEAYMQTYSQSLDLQQILEPVRTGDYGQPQAVYRITLSQAGIQSLSQAVGMDSMSDKLRSYMEERIQAAIATEINAGGGRHAPGRLQHLYRKQNLCMPGSDRERHISIHLWGRGPRCGLLSPGGGRERVRHRQLPAG